MAALTLEAYEGTGQFKGDPVTKLGFPAGSTSKEPAWNAADLGSIPGWEDSLEKGMATHSSILAWRIPWTEEPGGLQCMGCKEPDTTERQTTQRCH